MEHTFCVALIIIRCSCSRCLCSDWRCDVQDVEEYAALQLPSVQKKAFGTGNRTTSISPSLVGWSGRLGPSWDVGSIAASCGLSWALGRLQADTVSSVAEGGRSALQAGVSCETPGVAIDSAHQDSPS
uniref:Putative secreted protein n=1 Tax=Ixodes ricinus TaxID=34613 RepID=A0A6B0UQA0_IXORI